MFQGFTCVSFNYECGGAGYFAVPLFPPPMVVFLFHLRILISLSWCSTPGASCGQIAALFISLGINITHCTARFSGSNTDNGNSVLESLFLSVLFFSRPDCCGERHFCEQQASFVSRPFECSLIFSQTSFHPCWMVLSLAAGYGAVTAFQSDSTVASCTLNNNHVLLWLDAALAPDGTAVAHSPSTRCRRTKLLYWDLCRLLHLLGDMN